MNSRTFSARKIARALAVLAIAFIYSGSAQAWDNSNRPGPFVLTNTQAYPAIVPILEGSTTSHRGDIDSAMGNVYIYTGGILPAGTVFGRLRFLFDQGNSTGYITPLLFQQLYPNVYTVVGIGKGFPVAQAPITQSIPFVILEGVKVPYNNTFSFGYVNALVGARGLPLATSAGAVDFDGFQNPGNGIGGIGTTNAWNFTASYTGVPVTIGTTFGISGSGATYTFYPETRTYSALITALAP